ncbi:putative TIM-barrel fold metal-dependent hydrolase [Leifsonia psychrotolerans]|uniref:Putative TIM-barrel fold metal-dependent hydrolase n=1 Tax=Glaciibacter psychrotolerans TaxID=670054 RepID=A0A7Z0EBG6_9MICO|nr:amidohydrolase family protein [Leifsonia psychrotolerans]NYJ18391.1 putative TIM-barrel fold metal-dependent hydrolase [Leifsonia psychrotolerans]
MNRADAHIHLFEYGFSGTREAGAELADYEQIRTRYSIEHALVIGVEGEPRFAGNNDYILALARRHDWIAPLLFLDPAEPLLPAQVADALEAGAAGFSLELGADGEAVNAFDSDVWRVLDEANALLSLNVTPAGIAGVREVIRGRRGGATLLSHLGLPGPAADPAADPAAGTSPGAAEGHSDEWVARAAAVRDLADCPSVLVKLSGLYAIDPVFPHSRAQDETLHVLSEFGAERMLWGSDFAPGLGALAAEQLFDVPDWFVRAVSATELEQVMRGTLARLLASR